MWCTRPREGCCAGRCGMSADPQLKTAPPHPANRSVLRFYAVWCSSAIPGGPDAPDVDKLQPMTSTILWSEHGMVTPHKPAVSEGEYDCYCCDGCVLYCDRCGESYCTACDPDGCLAP